MFILHNQKALSGLRDGSMEVNFGISSTLLAFQKRRLRLALPYVEDKSLAGPSWFKTVILLQCAVEFSSWIAPYEIGFLMLRTARSPLRSTYLTNMTFLFLFFSVIALTEPSPWG